MKACNRYTTKSFSVAKIAHKYTHPHTFVEASITLMKIHCSYQVASDKRTDP